MSDVFLITWRKIITKKTCLCVPVGFAGKWRLSTPNLPQSVETVHINSSNTHGTSNTTNSTQRLSCVEGGTSLECSSYLAHSDTASSPVARAEFFLENWPTWLLKRLLYDKKKTCAELLVKKKNSSYFFPTHLPKGFHFVHKHMRHLATFQQQHKFETSRTVACQWSASLKWSQSTKSLSAARGAKSNFGFDPSKLKHRTKSMQGLE